MADTFRYERSIVIAAPPERIVAVIEDFHAWPKWSPWEKLDPDMQRSYSGAAKGVGAGYAWQGKKAGAGSMTLNELSTSRIRIALHFTKPFKADNVCEFDLTPDGGGTRVTWAMTGKQNLMSKVMGLFMNMDKMIGKDFEAGLASMKSVVEAG